MKINRKDPKHVTFIAKSMLFTTLATVASKFTKKNKTTTVVLYGHQLNGNIKAFLDYCVENKKNIDIYFMADPWYIKKLNARELGLKGLLNMSKFSDMLVVARSDIVMTTHGLHLFFKILKHARPRFIDVWHGIPYKGWAVDNFKEQHSYDQVWVSSPAMKKIYENMYKFPKRIVKSPGYARVDSLVRGDYEKSTILKKYSIQGYKKYILIAPTWKQDDSGRSIFPYGATAEELFKKLQLIGEKNDCLVIFRAHLNGGDNIEDVNYRNVRVMPHTDYPLTEEFLWIADILVSDWSSIVFDYLPLKRPTIFFDVPSPFKEGFTLGPEYRFGYVAKSLEGFTEALDRYIKEPDRYTDENRKKIQIAEEVCYGNTDDGKAAERYVSYLYSLLNKQKR